MIADTLTDAAARGRLGHILNDTLGNLNAKALVDIIQILSDHHRNNAEADLGNEFLRDSYDLDADEI